SLAHRVAGQAPRRLTSDGLDPGERDHGGAAQRPRDLGGPVPPGVDPDDVRQGRPTEFPPSRAGFRQDEAAMIRGLLPRLVRGELLSREETGAAVCSMMRGEVADAQIAAFLFALAQRGESGDEMLGGAEALRAEAVPFPASRETLLDTCGTGGD